MLDLLKPEQIFCLPAMLNKKQLLEEIANQASNALELDKHMVFDRLWEREKLGTTGIGQGIAIPHAKIDNLDQVYGIFVRLESPLAFESIDDKPVDLIFMLLAPSEAGEDHLRALGHASRILREKSFCAQLRNARDAKAIYNLLVGGTALAA